MRRRRDPFRKQLLDLCAYAFVAAYFFVWSYKTAIRHLLKVTSLGVISLSTVRLLVEFAIEWRRSETFHVMGLLPSLTKSNNVLFVIFTGAVSYLVWHHYRESRKPSYEYRFVKQLAQFMQGRQKNGNRTDTFIPLALQLFHRVFEHAGVRHCSVFRLKGSVLSIQPSHVYPHSDQLDYSVELKEGEGVAGEVFGDMMPRYVPRIHFPFSTKRRYLRTWSFPHALKFVPYEEKGELEIGLGKDSLRFGKFREPEGGTWTYKSFVSVPVQSVATGERFGVLNFDFNKIDPLDKSDILMAVVFGLILGDEIERLDEDTQPLEAG